MAQEIDKQTIEVFKLLLKTTKALETTGIIQDEDPEMTKELDKWLQDYDK